MNIIFIYSYTVRNQNKIGDSLYWWSGTKLANFQRHAYNWRNIPSLQIGNLHMVKISVLLNLFYRFNAIPNKVLANYFMDMKTMILKFIWRDKRLRMANSVEGKEKKLEECCYSATRLTV